MSILIIFCSRLAAASDAPPGDVVGSALAAVGLVALTAYFLLFIRFVRRRYLAD